MERIVYELPTYDVHKYDCVHNCFLYESSYSYLNQYEFLIKTISIRIGMVLILTTWERDPSLLIMYERRELYWQAYFAKFSVNAIGVTLTRQDMNSDMKECDDFISEYTDFDHDEQDIEIGLE